MLFRRRKKISAPVEIDPNDQWNRMWSMWADGKIESPYYELMSYHSEINNGGHYQFFSNTDNIENSEAVVETLCGILPENLKCSLQKAYKAYLNLENDINIDQSERDIKKSDEFFFENEDVIIKMLENHSKQF